MCNNLKNKETTSCDNCMNCLMSTTEELNSKTYTIDHEAEDIREKLLMSEEVRINNEYKQNKEWLEEYKKNQAIVNSLATEIIEDMIEDDRDNSLKELKERIKLYEHTH